MPSGSWRMPRSGDQSRDAVDLTSDTPEEQFRPPSGSSVQHQQFVPPIPPQRLHHHSYEQQQQQQRQHHFEQQQQQQQQRQQYEQQHTMNHAHDQQHPNFRFYKHHQEASDAMRFHHPGNFPTHPAPAGQSHDPRAASQQYRVERPSHPHFASPPDDVRRQNRRASPGFHENRQHAVPDVMDVSSPNATSVASPSKKKKRLPLPVAAPATGADNDELWDRHWQLLESYTMEELENSELAIHFRNTAVKRRAGPKGWAAMLGGGVIGMYSTKDEAIRRALCASMFHHELQSSQKKKKKDSDAEDDSPTEAPPPPPPPVSTERHKSPEPVAGGVPVGDLRQAVEESRRQERQRQVERKKLFDAKLEKPPSLTQAEKMVPLAEHEKAWHLPPSEKQTPPSLSTAVSKKSSRKESRVCQMFDPVVKKLEASFRSCAEAERFTKIDRSKIANACRGGGGVVNGKFFKYAPKGHASYTAKSHVVERSVDGDGSPGADSVEVVSVDRERIEANAKGTPPSGVRHPVTMPIVDKGYKAPKRPASVPEQTTVRRVRPKVLPTSSNKHSKKGEVRQSQSQNRSRFQYQFDVTGLRPLRTRHKQPVRHKKIIELIDVQSGHVLCCFRGNFDAGHALNIDRKEVARACRNYNTHDEVLFGTYKLRHAKNGLPGAYVYGDHPDDFRFCLTSPEERLEKWSRTFSLDMQNGVLDVEPPLVTGAEVPEQTPLLKNTVDTRTGQVASYISAQSRKKKKQEEPSLTTPYPKEFSLKDIGVGGTVIDTILDTNTKVVLRNPSCNTTDKICIICQTSPPQVVFEPCYHCILCARCAQKSCHNFCPRCRTPISSRVQPTYARVVRPRIYSAYSFMKNL